jgi:hypothetical protein
MSDEDRCPLNPSMLKAYCSHCQGKAPGTRDNPHFSLKEDYFNGQPIVEILKDGAAIHFWDSHFQFGKRKAEMLIVCIDILRAFWRSSGDQANSFVPRVVENKERSLRIRVYVEKHLDFERSDGATVDRPWLHLQALPPDNEHIGLGTLKCRAICEVEEDLRAWFRRKGAHN